MDDALAARGTPDLLWLRLPDQRKIIFLANRS
jgi:hypothetical protein